MMKYFIILMSFCLCFINKIHSSDFDRDKKIGELQWDSGRKYICYEFGLSNLLEIYIADGDSICDVSIHDGKGKCVSSTCSKSPILKWAFDNLTNEITMAQVMVDNQYKPYYYKLSIINDNSQTILSSSTLIIDYSNDLKEKIEELKAFIIKLWTHKIND